MQHCYPSLAKKLLLTALLWLFAATALLSPAAAQNTVSDVDEKNALLDLYHSTNGSQWTNPVNWTTQSVLSSSWTGVVMRDGDVVSLDIRSHNITGPLLSSLSKLEALETLDISNNLISGLPASFSTLTRLKTFRASTNRLAGPMPVDGLTNLVELSITNNQLTSIPPSIATLTKLVILRARANPITELPPAIGQLQSLKELDVSYNRLNQPLPQELGNLAALEYLRLHVNSIPGQLPPTMGQLTALKELNLTQNDLAGPIPVSMGNLRQLTYFNVSHNKLSGTLPTGFGSMPQLNYLDLGTNMFSGRLPEGLGRLPQLRTLRVHDNKFTTCPDFRQHPSVSSLVVSLFNNAICFGPLEPNANAGLPSSYNYSRQLMPAGEDSETQSVTEPIVISCSFSGIHNIYQWQKWNILYKNWETLSNTGAITGATAAVLRIAQPVLGDAGRYRCSVTNSIVTGLTLYTRTTSIILTPVPPTLIPTVQPTHPEDRNRNWTLERTYDGVDNTSGNILSEAKQFTDGLGRATQAQARSRATPHVFASETIYSAGGQPVLQTLAAPTNNQAFAYKDKFAAVDKQVAGMSTPEVVQYSAANFEGGKANNPDALRTMDPGTLGYYFSTNNELEPLTPTTTAPYSLTEPAEGPLGGIRRVAAPGDAFRMGSTHEQRGWEVPLLNEFDDYMRLRHHFVPGSNSLVTLIRQGTKAVSSDADGREVVTVANKEGQTLVSCLTSPQYPPTPVRSYISTVWSTTPRFVDIHIPATGEHAIRFTMRGRVRIKTLTGVGRVRLASGMTSPDSIDVEVNPAPANESAHTVAYLQPGFYRVISLPSTNVAEQTQWFTYDAEYGNFSYTYYDDAGRPVASIAPNGLPGNNLLRNPGFEQEQAQTLAPSAWESSNSSAYTENRHVAHGGQYYGVHWSAAAYSCTTSQRLTGLKPGRYTLRAWTRNVGGQSIAEMYIQSSLPAARRQVTLPQTGEWGAWVPVEIPNIVVGSLGECTVGFYSDSPVSTWIMFDDVVFYRQPDTSYPDFVTRNTYDTSSRLLATESNEAGRTEYVYARDGRIRFSQSALQRPANRFSYSNYDELGRVVESGEYTPGAGGTGHTFQSQLPKVVRYQAEESPRGGGVQDMTSPAGFDGSGFVGHFNQINAYLAFDVSVPTNATYSVRIRYAAGDQASAYRTMPLYVYTARQLPPGQSPYQYNLNFPATGSWDRWDVQTLELELTAGTNHIRFQQGQPNTGSNQEGFVNFDYLEIVSVPTPTTNSVLNILEERAPAANSLLAANCSQQNYVTYDEAAAVAGRTPEFTRGAVAQTRNDQVTTTYSYDELGRVTWAVQDIAGLGLKTLDYTYDFAGNVLQVAYQRGQPDAFHHYYEYDRAQRLYKVYTSTDGTERALQAKYFYYLHGPLKRVELANRLQGLDYTYTVQGWLKSINHVQSALDPSRDSPAGNNMPKDLFGLTLDYFSGDYQSRAQAAINPTGLATAGNPFRYDGTIRAAAWRTAAAPARYQVLYQYDEKSQLTESTFGQLYRTGSMTQFAFSPTANNPFSEGNLAYDPNGNLQNLRRKNQAGALTDNFSYEYTPGTNRLKTVHGGGSPTGAPVLDYEYDALGQMTREQEGGQNRYTTYDVSGKVLRVSANATHSLPIATFTYDDKGFRHSKITHDENGNTENTTYYVRDLAGNVLGTYESNSGNGNTPTRTEVPLYGASRVGTMVRLDNGTQDARYELTDHVGTARVVFHRPTTSVTTASFELTAAAQAEDGQWPGLLQARRHVGTTAHQGVTNPSTYVAYVDPAPAANTKAAVSRSVNVEKGDTLTFSAWAYLSEPGTAARAGRLRLLPLPATALAPDLTPANPTEAAASAPRRGWLSRLSAGVAVVGWGGQPTTSNATRTTTFATQVWLRTRFTPSDANSAVQERYEYLAPGQARQWQQFHTALRVSEPGMVEVAIGSSDPSWQTYFDNLRLEQTGSLIVQEQHTYAYGAPLPGLSYTVGNKRYRHGYQGQYAEKDAETGFESFELRMYNSRIGRWTSDDPYGQFSSPYLGMGNNPVSGVDPDGGWSWTGAALGAVTGGLIGGAIADASGGNFWSGAAIGGAVGGAAGGLFLSNSDIKHPGGTSLEFTYPNISLPKVSLPNLSFKSNPWVTIGQLSHNLPVVTQNHPLGCVPACSESLDGFFGGSRSEEDFIRNNNGGTLTNWRGVTNFVGYYYKNFRPGTMPPQLPPTQQQVAAELNANHPLTVQIGPFSSNGTPFNHNILIERIQQKVKNNGTIKYRLFTMDPGGQVSRIEPFNKVMRDLFIQVVTITGK